MFGDERAAAVSLRRNTAAQVPDSRQKDQAFPTPRAGWWRRKPQAGNLLRRGNASGFAALQRKALAQPPGHSGVRGIRVWRERQAG